MLDQTLKAQLKAYLEKVVHPISLNASLDSSPKSAELEALLQDIAALSPLVSYARTDDDARRPSFEIRRVAPEGAQKGAGTDIAVRFAGIPMGHEFTSLVLALLQVTGKPIPEVVVIGAQPYQVSAGVGLTPEMTALLPKIEQQALKELRQWQVEVKRK